MSILLLYFYLHMQEATVPYTEVSQGYFLGGSLRRPALVSCNQLST